jgi:hypothetical protein
MEDIICRRTTRRTAAVERTAHIIDVAIIIFNAALAYHVGSLNGNKAYAKRSIMLYSKVLKLLKNSRSFAGSSTASVVVKVAAMNNVSQLRFEERRGVPPSPRGSGPTISTYFYSERCLARGAKISL